MPGLYFSEEIMVAAFSQSYITMKPRILFTESHIHQKEMLLRKISTCSWQQPGLHQRHVLKSVNNVKLYLTIGHLLLTNVKTVSSNSQTTCFLLQNLWLISSVTCHHLILTIGPACFFWMWKFRTLCSWPTVRILRTCGFSHLCCHSPFNCPCFTCQWHQLVHVS